IVLGGLIAPEVKGTVWEGYSPRRSPLWPKGNEDRLPPAGARRPGHLDPAGFARAVVALRGSFPSGSEALDREISRSLAVLEDDSPAPLARVAGRITAASDPVEDTHYLIVLARLRGPRTPRITRQSAGALIAMDEKIGRRRLNRDLHWPLRVGELHAELAR